MFNEFSVDLFDGSKLTKADNEVADDSGRGCQCFIIPQDVLERFSKDKKLTEDERKSFLDAAKFEKEWRKVRNFNSKLARSARSILPTGLAATAAAPAITVYNCGHGNTLPGAPVANPGSSSDLTAKRAFTETTAVAQFYKTLFGRNSVDNAGQNADVIHSLQRELQ